MIMKKILKICFCICIFMCFNILADARTDIDVYDLNGKRSNDATVDVNDVIFKEDIENNLIIDTDKKFSDIPDGILSLTEEDENLIILDFKTDDNDNPYPEIESMDVDVDCKEPSGGQNYLGKDYRIIYYDKENLHDVSENIIDSDSRGVNFRINKLGTYIILFDPAVYSVIFYSDEPVYDDDGELINKGCIYKEIFNLKKMDEIIFPEIPEKDGYIFTGWKAPISNGSLHFFPPQPVYAVAHTKYFASWCPEDEYEPIVIEISSDEPITKGKEDGKKIRLTTNYGVFINDEEFPKEWRSAYESETDEQIKAEILQNWKSIWNIVGNDDIIIETAERIDDRTVELTLSGNSSDIYSNSDIYIEFVNYLLRPEPYEHNGEIIEGDDTKIKMDEDGVRARMYRSDNAVMLKKQSRPGSGGGSLTARYTVTFESNGANAVSSQKVDKNTTAKEPEPPVKEGYNFAGWFTDKEFTEKFDFSTKITKNITLYAKWENEDNTKNQIIFTIGKKEAMVFGEEKQNDVSPVLKGDRAYLPARFVAENLGAKVLWDNETRTVTITKDDKIIIIAIDKKTAIVNDETITLDAPAFIENDRTYTPMRFVAEELGASVDYDREEQIVTITKGD